MFRYLLNNFSQGYVRNIHQDQVTIALQHEYVSNCKDLVVARDFSFVFIVYLGTMLAYKCFAYCFLID